MRQYSGDHRPSAVEQTNDAIIRYLQDEGLKDGDRLPNERDLSAQLGVGRSTLIMRTSKVDFEILTYCSD